MSYKPKCLGHINIFVRNAERAREWYSDVLGLHTYDLRPDAAFLAADIEQSHEIALVQVGRAKALIEGRDAMLPEDVKAVAANVLRHRILLTYHADAEGVTSEQLIEQTLPGVKVP